MHHRSLAMRYSLFSMLPRWFSMHHILLSMHDRIPTNVVAKLQLNSDIPTNSDKIFIVFPVFLFLPLPSRRAHLHKIYDHLCENYDHLSTPLEGTSTKIMMTSTKIMMTSTRIMTTSTFLLSISATPQVLFTPKEHLPKPVQVNGVTPEVLIFSAETLVV